MSWLVIGAALVVFVLLAARWVVTRKGLAITVAALLVCVSLGGLEGRLALREHRWSVAASELLGQDVDVHCQRMLAYAIDVSPILGYVPYDPETGGPAREAYLRRDTCDALAAYDPAAPTREQVQALHVLTHEAMHMGGQRDEARAECEAVQRDVSMAMLLGATRDQASALSDAYWPEIHRTLPPNYQSANCGPGAEWDEGLDTAPWAGEPGARDGDGETAVAAQ